MENRRMVLIALMGVIVYFLYQQWQKDYGQASVAPPAAMATLASGGASATAATDRIHVETDKLSAEISLRGGDLRRLELKDYPLHKGQPDKLPLLNDRDGHWSILQAGLAGPERSYIDSDTVYASPQPGYRLPDAGDIVEVPLEYRDASGYTVRKLYRFHRGSYLVDLEQTLLNASGRPLQASPYVRWSRKPVSSGDEPPFARSFLGYGIYEQKSAGPDYRFKKKAFKDLDKENYETRQQGGWLVMLQHYFVAGIIPPDRETLSFSAKPSAGIAGAYTGQYLGASREIAAGASQTFPTKLYIGPTQQGTLEAVAHGFELTEDYGILTPVAKPLFWLLKLYHSWTGNWGAAIILLTLSVRLAFFKLTEAQYRSTAKMRKFGPRIQELRERYADNREQLNRAMMDLYKKEGFNPLAGCWPILIQFPVFLALYWVLSQSVELRQAPFALWLNDLTAPDAYFVLPVLYGASMWLMQKISGQAATMDPTQARIMNIMPIVLSGMFALFPSGLVLYWVVSNGLSIAQQWLILRRIERDERKG
jgi:YidC/Oxa1 family membrane protein insertase